jgi:hypothetical protein
LAAVRGQLLPGLVGAVTTRQTVIPKRLLGRTNAAYLFVAQGMKPICSLLGGWLGTHLGLRGALVVGTVGLLSTSLFLILSPLRKVRTLDSLRPEPPEEARATAPASMP